MDDYAKDERLRQLIQDACRNLLDGYDPLASEVDTLVRPMVTRKVNDVNSRIDVIQDVQVVVYERREWLKGTRKPTEVVRGIGMKKILHLHRYQKTGIRKVVSGNSETLASESGGVDPVKEVLNAEESELAEEFIQSLPPELRSIARLKITEEMTVAEICLETGLSRDVVRGRIERIKDAYRCWPKRNGGDHACP